MTAYEFELDEWHSDVRSMTETQRVRACRHSSRTGRVCPECGEEVDP